MIKISKYEKQMLILKTKCYVRNSTSFDILSIGFYYFDFITNFVMKKWFSTYIIQANTVIVFLRCKVRYKFKLNKIN